MNYLKINNEIEKLNLDWYEYDFGDTLYAKIPTSLVSQQTNITKDCQTEKYTIKFDRDGYTLIFKELEQISLVEKIVEAFSKTSSSFKGENSLKNS